MERTRFNQNTGMLVIVALSFLAGCSTPPPLPGSPAAMETAASSPDCERAREWEKWLLHDGKKMPEFCQKSDEKSAGPEGTWCDISEKRADLQKQYMGWRKQRLASTPAPKTRAVRPSWGKNGKLLNLAALQKASVSAIIRGLSKATRGHVKTLTQEALKSETCSGPLFLALASAWENFLPKAEFKLIGELYERSASCSASEAEDVTNTRFRGGLFFYASGDYEHARDLFEKSAAAPSSTRARSLFWLYRSHLKLGNHSKADDTIDKLENLHPTSFHGVLAIHFAERTPSVRSTSRWYTQRSDVPFLNTLLETAEKLQSCSCAAGTVPLLNWAIGQLPPQPDPKLMLYIAKLREAAGENPVKIAIAADALSANPSLVSRETLELFYPRPFWNFFETQKGTIDPYFLMAVARQESAFDPGAVSSARAVGLLQLLPHTARRFKKHPNLRSPKENIEVGARYLSSLLKSMDGKVYNSLASYNAGPGKVKLWMTRYQTEDAILFVDLIPYRETREYVAAVLRNYFWYRTLYGPQAETAVVAGAFPADLVAVAQLRKASDPSATLAASASEKTAEKPEKLEKPEKPSAEIAKAPKDVPSNVEAEGPAMKPGVSAAKTAEDKIADSAQKSVEPVAEEETSKGELTKGTAAAEEDSSQLPEEISIAPEIDKSQPN